MSRSQIGSPRRGSSLLVALLLLLASVGHAARPRTRTHYDGRPPPRTSVGHTLLWVPRVLLYPVYAVWEYGLRAPLGAATTAVEEHHVDDRVLHWIHPKSTLTIVPTLFLDLGILSNSATFVPTGGIYFAWHRALLPNNELRLHASTGGPGYWYFSLADRIALTHDSRLLFRASYLERKDWQFYGLGPDSREDQLQRFHWSRGEGALGYEYGYHQHAGLGVTVGARVDQFGTPRLSPIDAPGIPGDSDFSSAFAHGAAFLDTRPWWNAAASGIRIAGEGEYHADMGSPLGRRWLTYGAEGSLFWEIKKPGRVIALRGLGLFADSLSPQEVPFIDQVQLGGESTMRGWFYGRFRGESAAVASIDYRYPVWYLLDGTVFYEVGNTFGHHLARFDAGALHGSFGLGLRTTGSRDASFDILLAVGTSRFDEPFSIDNVRLAIGFHGLP